MLSDGVKAINLGCGVSVAPGWINIDNSFNARLSKYPFFRWSLWKLGILSDQHYRVRWPESIEICNLKKRLSYEDSSIDYAYTSHFLEHLAFKDAQRLMGELYRVLKPGGVVRVVVPDLAIGARQYVASLEADPNDAKAAAEFLNWMQLGKPGVRDPHLWMYDAPSLAAALGEVGFGNVVVCEYRRGRIPDCDILDNRPEDSLHLEAEKPAV
ncbi:MAG TPA: methyltransferase domain-containing protein [Blastocatellia bacterium]|jgi:SAM-dependent methyltransferase